MPLSWFVRFFAPPVLFVLWSFLLFMSTAPVTGLVGLLGQHANWKEMFLQHVAIIDPICSFLFLSLSLSLSLSFPLFICPIDRRCYWKDAQSILGWTGTSQEIPWPIENCLSIVWPRPGTLSRLMKWTCLVIDPVPSLFSPRPVLFVLKLFDYFLSFSDRKSVQVFCLPIVQMIVHW